jgi:DNA-binding CsgD family transcriptional regulator
VPKKFILRERGLAVAGWSFHMLSITLLTWDTDSWYSSSIKSSAIVENLLLAMLIAYFVGFIALAMLGFSKFRIKEDKSIAVLSTIFIIAGSLLALLSDSIILKLFGFILLGINNALIFVLWQRILSKCSAYTAGVILAIGTAGATILFLGFNLIPFSINPLALALSAGLVSLVFAFSSLDKFSSNIKSYQSPEHMVYFLAGRLWRPVLCVGFLGFIWELLTPFGPSKALLGISMGFALPLAQLAGIIIFIPLWMKYYDRILLTNVYQIVFPIMATGFLLMPFLDTVYKAGFVSLACLVFGVVSILMQVTCIQEYEGSQIDPIIITGIFAGIVYAFMVVGYFAGRLIVRIGEINTTQLVVIAMLVIYMLSLIHFAIGLKDKRAKTAKMIQDNGMEANLSRCQTLADKYSLTKRECEVLVLLSKGRDLPYISEALYISKNTVRSHLKNMYLKIDIHSKQDLLNLIDDTSE